MYTVTPVNAKVYTSKFLLAHLRKDKKKIMKWKIAERTISCHYLLKAYLYQFKLVNKAFLVKNSNLTSNKKRGWRISEYFASQYNTETVLILFSYFIARSIPTSYFGYFEHVWLLPSKIMPTCRNFDVYLQAKNELCPYLLFWHIVKILETCNFEYFYNAWSCPSIMPVSPCSEF